MTNTENLQKKINQRIDLIDPERVVIQADFLLKPFQKKDENQKLFEKLAELIHNDSDILFEKEKSTHQFIKNNLGYSLIKELNETPEKRTWYQKETNNEISKQTVQLKNTKIHQITDESYIEKTEKQITDITKDIVRYLSQLTISPIPRILQFDTCDEIIKIQNEQKYQYHSIKKEKKFGMETLDQMLEHIQKLEETQYILHLNQNDIDHLFQTIQHKEKKQ